MSQRGEIEAFFGIWYQSRLGKSPKGVLTVQDALTVQDFSLPAYVRQEGNDLDEIVPSFLVHIKVNKHDKKSRFYAGEGSDLQKEATDLALQLYLHKGVLVFPKITTDD